MTTTQTTSGVSRSSETTSEVPRSSETSSDNLSPLPTPLRSSDFAPLTGRLIEKTDGDYWRHHAIGVPLRARPKWPALLYIFEGEIGAGKTVICQEVAKELRAAGKNVCLILEPVDCWRSIGILKKFYKDRARHGYGFQTFVFATRVLAIERAIKAEPEADVYLLERSPATDQIFMELQRDLLDEVEMKMYETWCATYQELLRIDISKARVLYLKPSLEQCMSRTKARAMFAPPRMPRPRTAETRMALTRSICSGKPQRHPEHSASTLHIMYLAAVNSLQNWIRI